MRPPCLSPTSSLLPRVTSTSSPYEERQCSQGRLHLDSAHSRQRRFCRRSGIGRKLATHKNEVCLLPKQLGEQVAKLQVRALWELEFVALVRVQVKPLDFKRNYGIVKRSCDLLPVRPCWLQADNNDAHLLPESWMRNWRSRTFVQSMVSFVVAFFHEHVLAQLDFLRYWKVNEACKSVWLMGRPVSECQLLIFKGIFLERHKVQFSHPQRIVRRMICCQAART